MRGSTARYERIFIAHHYGSIIGARLGLSSGYILPREMLEGALI